MPDQLSLSDVVPVLRADLQIGDPQPGRGESEIHVEDTTTGKFLVMKGFELSLARMLNGRRTAEEVLTAAGQIGLPMSIESLNGFLRKLRKEGFLTELAGMAPIDITTWEARSEWNEEIRRLFQEALREARADRFVAAKSRLDALLARSPAIKEAQQLLHWVMERLRPESGPNTPPFSDVFAQVEKGWFHEGEQSSAINERAHVEKPSFEDPTVPAEPGWRPPGKSKKGLVIGALAVAAMGGLLIAPMPHTATAPFTLVPRAVTPVALSRSGTLSAVSVNEGQWVDKGATLAKWDTTAAQKKIVVLQAKLAEVQKKNKAGAATAKKLQDAQGKLDKASAAQSKAQADLDKLKASKAKKPAIAKAEKKAAAAKAAVAAAQKIVAGLTVPLAPAIQGEVTMIEGELERAKFESTDLLVVANADGFVQGLAAKPGQPAEAGAVIARLEDSRTLKVVITVPRGESLAVGTPVQLKVGTVAAKAVVEKVDGTSAEAPLDNAKGGFKGGATGESSFAGVSKSLLGRL
jgi:multidrug resistance efflux pump